MATKKPAAKPAKKTIAPAKGAKKTMPAKGKQAAPAKKSVASTKKAAPPENC